MSSFKDSFTRGNQDQNLQYDETAFNYFLISILVIVCLIIFVNVIKTIFENPLRFGKPQICNCVTCLSKYSLLERTAHRKKLNMSFLFKILLIVFLVFISQKLLDNTPTNNQLKVFDPFQILELDETATETQIKKQFNKLVLKYHPDKNPSPDANAKFILISKAKETLLDPQKRQMYQKYGNPDGPGSFKISIAMPKLFLDKRNQIPILEVFFVVVLIVLPLIFYYIQGNDLSSDGRGLQPETQMILVKSLNEQLNAKQCPIHLAAIKEFRPLTTHSQKEEQFLKTVKNFIANPQLLRFINGEIDEENCKPSKRNQYPISNKAFVLLVGYLMRQDMIPEVEEDIRQILKMAIVCAEFMVEVAIQFSSRQRHPNRDIKFCGATTMNALIEFEQMVVTATSRRIHQSQGQIIEGIKIQRTEGIQRNTVQKINSNQG